MFGILEVAAQKLQTVLLLIAVRKAAEHLPKSRVHLFACARQLQKCGRCIARFGLEQKFELRVVTEKQRLPQVRNRFWGENIRKPICHDAAEFFKSLQFSIAAGTSAGGN